jgi:ABC-type transport system involved in multi-copper enzyme maturation permease subunit
VSAGPGAMAARLAGRAPEDLRARRWRQAAAVFRLELKRSLLGGRALGLYLLALLPVAFYLLRLLFPAGTVDAGDTGQATLIFASTFQGFLLRMVVYLGCVEIFGNLIRREVLDRSLHFYFLAPLRRELLAAAKLAAGLAVAIGLFGLSTLVSFALCYLPYDGAGRFFLHGPGLGHLAAYLGVTALACVGYGAVFFAIGLFGKSPAIPAIALFGWEWLNFLLPPGLKRLSIVHYLESSCPVPVPQGPLAVPADAPNPWLAIPSLLLLTAALLAFAMWKVRRMEVRYEEE